MKKVVRRRLDDDCLLDGELHPSIAERLQRVRELPMGNAANFHGVERNDRGVWLLWEFVPGMTLEEFLAQPHDSSQRARMAQDLRRAIHALHSHGIVHGALHARNIIIDLQGRLHLTHISPLLWSDTAADESAMKLLMEQMGEQADEGPLDAMEDDIDSLHVRRNAYLLSLAAVAAAAVIFVAVLWYTRA